MKTLLSKYKHVWTLLYFPVYLAVFFWLENRSVSKYHVVQSTLDSHIPFLEIFIIPYFLWFGFVALGVVYFFFKDVKDYYRLIAFLYSGMTIFLIWSYVYPNVCFCVRWRSQETTSSSVWCSTYTQSTHRQTCSPVSMYLTPSALRSPC